MATMKKAPVRKTPVKKAAPAYKSTSEKKDYGKKGMLAGIVADNVKTGVKNSKAGKAVTKVASAAKTAKTYVGNRISDPRQIGQDYYKADQKVRDRVVNSVRKSAPKATAKKRTTK